MLAPENLITVMLRYRALTKAFLAQRLPGMKKESADEKYKVLPVEALGTCMMKHGVLLTDESPYGQALIKCGEAQERLATVQLDYVGHLRDTYMVSLDRSMSDMKQYQHLRKKLENRRLDFDAKLNKVQKSTKEKPELEEGMRTAQAKYEESISELQNRMFKLTESEEEHLRELVSFVDAQLNYFVQGAEVLRNLSQVLTDRSVRAVPRANLSRVSSTHKLNTLDNASNRSFGETVAEPDSYDTTNSRAQNMAEREHSMSRSSSGNLSEHLSFNTGGRPTIWKHSSLSQSEGISTPPSTMSGTSSITKKLVRATFEFESKDESELSISKGDIITVLDEIDDGWWIGELVDSAGNVRRGMFPSNYTEPAPMAAPQPVPRPLPRNNSRDQVLPVAAMAAHLVRSGSSDALPTVAPRSTTASPNQLAIPARQLPPGAGAPVTSSRGPLAPALARMAVPKPQNNLETAAAKQPTMATDVLPCRECGCDEFSANMFKKGNCNNCFHKHE